MSTPRLAYLALAAGVFCIGWSAIFVKLAAVPGLTSAFYRSFFAAAVLLPWYFAQRLTRTGPAVPIAGLWTTAAAVLRHGGHLLLFGTASVPAQWPPTFEPVSSGHVSGTTVVITLAKRL